MNTPYTVHIKKTFSLAYPVSLSQLGHILAGFIDSVMVGQLGILPLAASSLGNNIFMLVMIAGIGMTNSITPLVARGHGGNNPEKISKIMSNAMIINIIVGFFLFTLMYTCGPILYHLGQEKDIIDQTVPYYNILALSILPIMVFQSYRQFAEGLSKTRPAMIVMITGSLANIFLNYLFIFGNWGFPAMGLIGAGWATFISRILMMLMMAFHIHSHKYYNEFTKKFNFIKLSGKTILNILSIGLPISLQLVLEVGAFAFMAVMMGWLGEAALASHQIALSYSSISFMIILGISSAATIRTSKIIGKKDFNKLKRTGNSAVILATFFTTISAIIFISCNKILPLIYTDKSEVVAIASQLLIIAGLFQIVDGIQVVILGVLRGMTDVKIPSLIATMAYWIIGLPIGYILAFHFKLGGTGVWLSLLVGFTIAGITSYLRFKVMLKRLCS